MSCGNHATAFVMQIKLNVFYNIYCGEALAADCCPPIMSLGASLSVLRFCLLFPSVKAIHPSSSALKVSL